MKQSIHRYLLKKTLLWLSEKKLRAKGKVTIDTTKHSGRLARWLHQSAKEEKFWQEQQATGRSLLQKKYQFCVLSQLKPYGRYTK